MADNSFTACILVGGKGSRLGTLAANTPKCLIPIYGVPFLKLLVNKLFYEGCSKIILAAGHLSGVIEKYAATNFNGHAVDFVIETGGTGKALLQAIKIAKMHDDIVCLNGDTLLDIRYDEVVRYHRATAAVATIVTTQSHELASGGDVAIGLGNRVLSFNEREHPSGAVIQNNSNCKAGNCGCYCFNVARTRDFLETNGGSSLERDVLPKLIRDAEVLSYNYRNTNFLDFGTPDRLSSLPDKFPLAEINRIFHLYNG